MRRCFFRPREPTPKRSSAGFYYPIGTLDDFQKWATTAFAERDRDESAGFATREKPTGEFIGSTRCMSISLLEIGSIWVIPCWQRTAVNTEAKYLMLRHSFETLDALNQKSRAAILRLGAKQKGTFHKHPVTSTGRARDTVYFSILDEEWPAVNKGLESKLQAASC